jgi:hypothetical protein
MAASSVAVGIAKRFSLKMGFETIQLYAKRSCLEGPIRAGDALPKRISKNGLSVVLARNP